MEINKKTINETIHCENNFECLENENYSCLLMKIDNCIGEKVLFINCTKTNCYYKMNYGNSIICNCPTRTEIYHKYKKYKNICTQQPFAVVSTKD